MLKKIGEKIIAQNEKEGIRPRKEKSEIPIGLIAALFALFVVGALAFGGNFDKDITKAPQPQTGITSGLSEVKKPAPVEAQELPEGIYT